MERIPRVIYAWEFREQAVRLHEVEGRTIPEIVKRLSLPGRDAENWIYVARRLKPGEVDKNQPAD